MNIIKNILLLLISFLFWGCTNTEKPRVTLNDIQKFKGIIFEVSSGIISASEQIKVVLMKPMKDISGPVELDNSLFDISPKISGRVMALNNRTIAFVPTNKFKSDTRYTFKLNLGAIQKVDEANKIFAFDIKTIKQEFKVHTSNLNSYSKDWQYLNCVIRFSDKTLATTAKQLITAKQKGKSLPIKIESYISEGEYFRIKIDSIERYEDDSKIEIKWNGKKFHIDSKGELDYKISGKNNFKVVDVNVSDERRKYIEINFSDPVNVDQNLKGLITLEGVDDLSFSTEENVVKVYIKNVNDTKKLHIHKGIKNGYDYKLKETYTKDILFGAIKPNIKLLQNGTILPTSKNLKFNFEAVGLKAVDVTIIKIFEDNVLQFLQNNELNGSKGLLRVARPLAKKTINLKDYGDNLTIWNTYSIDLKKIINPDPGAIYRIELSFKKQYSNYKCINQDDDDPIIEESIDYDSEANQQSYWDYNYNQDYEWSESGDPCKNSYYRNKTLRTNILASNIGVIIKKGEKNNYFVAASEIITTNPIANAKVTFYNYQQQLIGSKYTDYNGKLSITIGSKAYFAIVTKNKISTYVKLMDGSSLSVSKFDVSGVKIKRGLKGFIYGERGVWRPGDTLHLSFILNDKNNKLPIKHPVKLEILSPQGTLQYSYINTKGLNNFYKFTVPTQSDDPTGNWTAKISVGGAHFTKRLKIETIKPNRLKIKTSIEEELITSNDTVKGSIKASWLHGAIAKDLKADIKVSFSSIRTNFKAFPGFNFDDPTKTFSSKEKLIFDGKVDGEGKANFTFKPTIKNSPAGLLRANFITKVYENGGDFSTDAFSAKYSSYKSYVGLLVPKGDKARNMLLTDKKHTFEVATVDTHGKPMSVKNVKVTIYKINHDWWWNEADDNLSSFDTSSHKEETFTTRVSTNSNGKGTFKFELKYPEWGRYLVHVTNEESGHTTGKTVFIDWPGWAGRAKKGDPSSPTMLSFSTNKTKYKVGERALITFPSSGQGRALITVENSTRVIKGFWVKATKGNTKFKLPITKEMTPNVFINISLLQKHNNTKNDLPIRMYGITGISVENPQTKLSPKITMPEVLAPEKEVTIKVSEAKGRPMTYSIAIVDEGLLSLTRFKTPNPWSTFYANEALGVKTWDVYDHVIGAFGGKINQVFSIGGDGMLSGSKNKKANRFKPMVIYKGPFKLGRNGRKSHRIKIPKYIGSVRTMVVAHNVEKEAYGSAEKATPVRKPLMVLASMARKVVPKEKIRIPITVFAMENKIKQVNVSIKTNSIFKVIGKSSKAISFTNLDEKMVYFDVEVLKNGIGKIEISASGNGEKASYDIEIDSYNPNPESRETTDLLLLPNISKTLSFKTFGVLGTNHASLELSAFPTMDFTARLQYLIKYPHGCVEQTTSSAFPQLYLNDIFKVSKSKKKETQKNIQFAIKKLAKFQKNNGGFSYWQNQTNVNDWATSYVGHFLLEAEKKGFLLPSEFKSNWIKYQKKTSERWSSSSDQLAQTYRLYTLALAGKPNRSAMNRLIEQEDLKPLAKLRLAATYALIGKSSASEELISKFITFESLAKIASLEKTNYGSKMRNYAMILETFVLLKKEIKAKEMAEAIALALTSDTYMSTQTTSYCLLAMSKYAKLIGNKGLNLQYSVNGNKQKLVNSNRAVILDGFKVNLGNNTIEIKNNKNNTIYIRLLNNGTLPIGSEKVIQKGLLTEMVFSDKSNNPIDVSNIKQGSNFVANITLQNTGATLVKDIALSAIFPSGWEIINTRLNLPDSKNSEITNEDIRDDRVYYYFDLKANETKTFKVLLNASYLGSYYLPGLQGESMYDDRYFVRTKGKWVKVVE